MSDDASSGFHDGPRRESGRDSPGAFAHDSSQLLQSDHLLQAPILIVDDQPTNIAVIRALLGRAGFVNLFSTTKAHETLQLIDATRPWLLLLDLHMPGMDGFAVLERLREAQSPRVYFPILVLTADSSPTIKARALAGGAHDFLIKPFDTAEVQLRVTNLLRTRALYGALQAQNETLEQRVRERTEDLERSRVETLRALALAAEFRDDETGQHTRRVGQLSADIGRALALPAAEVDVLRRAAALHDLGKIGIPDRVLLKPGIFTTEERTLMQEHTTIGFQIMEPCQSTTLRMARQIALTHHERWDGGGYPHGLQDELIPLVGRIVAVADAFDAMTHDRPYQKARPAEAAMEEIARERGGQFDPRVADAMQLIMTAHAA